MQVLRKKVDQAFGMIGKKKDLVLKCEKYGEKNLKRSIYSLKTLKKGEKINKNNIICLRHYNKKGVKIENFYKFLNKKVKRKINRLALIKKTDLR